MLQPSAANLPRALPLWVALTAPSSRAGWMEKHFTILRESVFGQADPDGEKIPIATQDCREAADQINAEKITGNTRC